MTLALMALPGGTASASSITGTSHVSLVKDGAVTAAGGCKDSRTVSCEQIHSLILVRLNGTPVGIAKQEGTVEAWKRRPEPDLDAWEEAIEFSLRLREEAHLESILSNHGLDFALPAPAPVRPGMTRTGSYRLRLHAKGRQRAEERQHISIDHGDELIEQHLFQIWAARPSPVQWLKELT